MPRRNALIAILIVTVSVIIIAVYLLQSRSGDTSVSLESNPKASCTVVTHSTAASVSEIKTDISYPQFTGCSNISGQDGLNKLINDTITEATASVKSTYATAGNLVIDYVLEYKSDKLISVMLKGNVFSTNTRGVSVYYPINYDLVHSKQLKIADVQANGDLVNQVSTYSIQDLKLQTAGTLTDSALELGAGKKSDNFEKFSITSSGLKIVFGDNQLGSYDVGSKTVFVPWGKIRGNLSSSFRDLVEI